MAGCRECGEYKAPKSRGLNEYHWFCLEHVQQYNKAWNYFSGMSEHEMQEQILRSAYWDRPTWNYKNFKHYEDSIYRKAWQTFHNTDEEPPEAGDEKRRQHYTGFDKSSPEYQAMVMMGLEPPLTLDRIKKRYKELAKQYHPDLNQGDKAAEDLLKGINMSYTILKAAYEKFETLDPHEE